MATKINKAQTTGICPKCGRPYLRTGTIPDGIFYVHREGERKYSGSYTRLGYAFKRVTVPTFTFTPAMGCTVTSGGSAENVRQPGPDSRKASDILGWIGVLIFVGIVIAVNASHC